MKFESGESTVYVKVKNIISVSLMEGLNYNSEEKEKEFYVEVTSTAGMMNRILTTKNENEARNIQIQIGEKLDDKDEEKMYLDGFKEGTEYALKLINVKDK